MSLLDYVSRPKNIGEKSRLRPALLWADFCLWRWTGRSLLLKHPVRLSALPPYITPEPTAENIALYARTVQANLADPTRHLYRRAMELGPRILEIGCGSGTLAVAMALRGKEVWCGDSDRHVNLVGPLADHLGVAESVRPVRFSGEALPFRDAAFDAVVMRASLEHVPELDRCLSEVVRVLRPGGTFLFSVPAFPWYEVQAFLRGDPDLIFDFAHLHPSELNYWAWRRALKRHFPSVGIWGKEIPGLGELGSRFSLPPFPSWADRVFAPFSSRLVGEAVKAP